MKGYQVEANFTLNGEQRHFSTPFLPTFELVRETIHQLEEDLTTTNATNIELFINDVEMVVTRHTLINGECEEIKTSDSE